MSDLTPASPTLNATLTAASSGAQNNPSELILLGPAQIVQLPDKLQVLDRTVLLGGQINGQNPDGTVNIKTALGDIVVKPSVLPPPGQQSVTLQIQAGAPPSNSAVFINSTITNNMPTLTNVLANMQQTIQTAQAQLVLPDLMPGSLVTAIVVPPTQQSDSRNEENTNDSEQQNSDPQSSQSFTRPSNTPSQNNAGNAAYNNASSNEAPILPNKAAFGATYSPTLSSLALVNVPAELLETAQQTFTLAADNQPLSVPNSNALNVQNVLGPETAVATAPPELFASIPSASSFPIGTKVPLQILQIAEPGAPVQTLSNIAALSTVAQLQGKVISNVQIETGKFQIIIATDQGQFAVQSGSKLPVETKILFANMQPLQQMVKMVASNGLVPLKDVNGKDWPALQTVLESLLAQNVPTAGHVLNSIPKFNGDLPATALFFLVGLRSSNVKHWLGENGAGEMAEQILTTPDEKAALKMLGQDFSELKDAKLSTPDGQWKLYNMPYMADQGLQRMQLAVRDHYEPLQDGEEGNGADGTRVTRFMINVDFSAFGSVQLDGFMRDKKIDLIVRAQNTFPDGMRSDMAALYNDTLGSQGLNGTLTFQAGNANWIKLMQARQQGVASYSA